MGQLPEAVPNQRTVAPGIKLPTSSGMRSVLKYYSMQLPACLQLKSKPHGPSLKVQVLDAPSLYVRGHVHDKAPSIAARAPSVQNKSQIIGKIMGSPREQVPNQIKKRNKSKRDELREMRAIYDYVNKLRSVWRATNWL